MTTRTLVDPTGSRQCSVAKCDRPAAAVERRRTESMPATGFYPVCAEHLELPSARAALLAGLAVHQTGKTGWAIYPTESGYDLYPGDEGPQRGLTLGGALWSVGGDQVCRLAPLGREVWGTLAGSVQQRVLDAECQEPAETPQECLRDLTAIQSALDLLGQLMDTGKLSANDARATLIALENRRHECFLDALTESATL